MKTQDRKDIIEAVLIATFCTVATGLVDLGFELMKEKYFKKPEQPEQPKDDSKTETKPVETNPETKSLTSSWRRYLSR